MNIYGNLIRAQLETKTSDYSAGLTGAIWWHSTDGKIHFSDGSLVRSLLRNDGACIIGNSGTAAQNIRFHRAGAAKLQLAKADDVTAEGSISNTSIVELISRTENYNNASKPTNSASNAGRLIYNTTDDQIEWDNGTSWIGAASASGSGSVDAVDVVIDKIYQNKDRGLNELLPNSVAESFVNGNTNYQCYLLEDYTASGSTLKMVTSPVFVETADPLTDSATNWSAGANTTKNAVSATRKVGTNSLSFDKNGAATTGFLSITAFGGSVYQNSNLYFWIQCPAGIASTLANVFVRLGSTSGNYRQWTFTTDYVGTTIASATWHLLKQDVSDTSGSTTAGTGWTTATNLSYFAVGITTDASGDTQAAVLVDGIFFADSSGQFAALGDQLTIYNASTRDSFGIDAASTTYNGLITLVASLSNSYSAVAATVIKRVTLTVGSTIAVPLNGLSGTIKTTQEVRIRRILPVAITNKNFKAFATFLSSEQYYVTAVNASTSIVVESTEDTSADWKSGRVVDVAQKMGNGNGTYDYIPRTDVTYTLTGNSTYSGTSLTLPMTNTGTVAVGDLVVKRQVNCYSSVASKTANEVYSAMTRDRIEIIDPGIPYFYPSTVWAHYTLSGTRSNINIAPGGGGSGGLNLTTNGVPTQYNSFAKSRFSSSGFTDSDNYSLTGAASEPISGDSADDTNIALSFWFYASAFTGTTRGLVVKGSTADSLGWAVDLGSGGNTVTFEADAASVGLGTFSVNAWNHVYVFTTDGTQTCYLNGVVSTGSNGISDNTYVFRVGRYSNSGKPATGVQLADLVIWRNTTLLTAGQVNSIYNNRYINVFGTYSSGFKYRFSQLAQTGQKISLKAEITREADSDNPALWAIGLVKT